MGKEKERKEIVERFLFRFSFTVTCVAFHWRESVKF